MATSSKHDGSGQKSTTKIYTFEEWLEICTDMVSIDFLIAAKLGNIKKVSALWKSFVYDDKFQALSELPSDFSCNFPMRDQLLEYIASFGLDYQDDLLHLKCNLRAIH